MLCALLLEGVVVQIPNGELHVGDFASRVIKQMWKVSV